jgi:hypothetical protein
MKKNTQIKTRKAAQAKNKKTVETKTLSVSKVPLTTHKKLETKAKKAGVKKSEFVRQIISDGLKK